MALTPEDVVTKQFQHVRFKEGFDPDEVDDFLDEIVVEWRKTIAENDELKARVAGGGDEAAAAAPAASNEELQARDNEIAELKARIAELEAAPQAQPEAGAEETPAPVSAAAPAAGGAAASAGIIELAQRLHDEHVAEGQAQRDKLISDAQAQATAIVSEAEAKGRDEMARLDSERATLETRISELRQFERDYRAQLRGFIEEKLRDLDVAGATTGTPVSAS